MAPDVRPARPNGTAGELVARLWCEGRSNRTGPADYFAMIGSSISSKRPSSSFIGEFHSRGDGPHLQNLGGKWPKHIMRVRLEPEPPVEVCAVQNRMRS